MSIIQHVEPTRLKVRLYLATKYHDQSHFLDQSLDFMPMPKGRPKLNRPCLSPDNKFYIVMQEDQVSMHAIISWVIFKKRGHVLPQAVMSSGKVSIQEKMDTAEEMGVNDELEFTGGIDITEASAK